MAKKHKKQPSLKRPPVDGRELDRGTPELARHYEMDIVVIDKVKVAKLRDRRCIDKYYRLYQLDEDNQLSNLAASAGALKRPGQSSFPQRPGARFPA